MSALSSLAWKLRCGRALEPATTLEVMEIRRQQELLLAAHLAGYSSSSIKLLETELGKIQQITTKMMTQVRHDPDAEVIREESKKAGTLTKNQRRNTKAQVSYTTAKAKTFILGSLLNDVQPVNLHGFGGGVEAWLKGEEYVMTKKQVHDQFSRNLKLNEIMTPQNALFPEPGAANQLLASMYHINVVGNNPILMFLACALAYVEHMYDNISVETDHKRAITTDPVLGLLATLLKTRFIIRDPVQRMNRLYNAKNTSICHQLATICYMMMQMTYIDDDARVMDLELLRLRFSDPFKSVQSLFPAIKTMAYTDGTIIPYGIDTTLQTCKQLPGRITVDTTVVVDEKAIRGELTVMREMGLTFRADVLQQVLEGRYRGDPYTLVLPQQYERRSYLHAPQLPAFVKQSDVAVELWDKPRPYLQYDYEIKSYLMNKYADEFTLSGFLKALLRTATPNSSGNTPKWEEPVIRDIFGQLRKTSGRSQTAAVKNLTLGSKIWQMLTSFENIFAAMAGIAEFVRIDDLYDQRKPKVARYVDMLSDTVKFKYPFEKIAEIVTDKPWRYVVRYENGRPKMTKEYFDYIYGSTLATIGNRVVLNQKPARVVVVVPFSSSLSPYQEVMNKIQSDELYGDSIGVGFTINPLDPVTFVMSQSGVKMGGDASEFDMHVTTHAAVNSIRVIHERLLIDDRLGLPPGVDANLLRINVESGLWSITETGVVYDVLNPERLIGFAARVWQNALQIEIGLCHPVTVTPLNAETVYILQTDELTKERVKGLDVTRNEYQPANEYGLGVVVIDKQPFLFSMSLTGRMCSGKWTTLSENSIITLSIAKTMKDPLYNKFQMKGVRDSATGDDYLGTFAIPDAVTIDTVQIAEEFSRLYLENGFKAKQVAQTVGTNLTVTEYTKKLFLGGRMFMRSGVSGTIENPDNGMTPVDTLSILKAHLDLLVTKGLSARFASSWAFYTFMTIGYDQIRSNSRTKERLVNRIPACVIWLDTDYGNGIGVKRHLFPNHSIETFYHLAQDADPDHKLQRWFEMGAGYMKTLKSLTGMIKSSIEHNVTPDVIATAREIWDYSIFDARRIESAKKTPEALYSKRFDTLVSTVALGLVDQFLRQEISLRNRSYKPVSYASKLAALRTLTFAEVKSPHVTCVCAVYPTNKEYRRLFTYGIGSSTYTVKQLSSVIEKVVNGTGMTIDALLRMVGAYVRSTGAQRVFRYNDLVSLGVLPGEISDIAEFMSVEIVPPSVIMGSHWATEMFALVDKSVVEGKMNLTFTVGSAQTEAVNNVLSLLLLCLIADGAYELGSGLAGVIRMPPVDFVQAISQ